MNQSQNPNAPQDQSPNVNVPSSKYTPDGKQQHTATNNTPIAHPDGPDAVASSEGNQAVKQAVENLHPRDMARNLDPTNPAPQQVQQQAPAFITETQSNSDQRNEQGLPASATGDAKDARQPQ